MLHQKFYLFLWFWLLFITAVTVLHQVYRVALLSVPGFRDFVTNEIWTGNIYIIATIITILSVTEHDNDMELLIKNIVDKTSYSDWILLSFFHSNLTTVNFQNFLEDLAFNYKERDLKQK